MDPSIIKENNSNDATVITLNRSCPKEIASALRKGIPKVLAFADMHAIADTRAISIFVMAGTHMSNIRPALDALTINLPNGEIVYSTHMCNISIPGLPMILTGHIIPGISMASLMGIRVLCKAGCAVTFTNTKCEVKYKDKVVILNGIKDPTTDLWTLPITPTAISAKRNQHVGKDWLDHKNPPHVDWAAFTHSIRTSANAVRFAHQSLCNPKISSLMKAMKKGFLKRVPQPQRRAGHRISEPQPCDHERPHEAPKERDSQHEDKATPNSDVTACRHFNPATAHRTSEPADPLTVQRCVPIPWPSVPSDERPQHHCQ